MANRDYEKQQIVYDENPDGEGMNFEVHVKVVAQGGTLKNSNNQLVDIQCRCSYHLSF